MRISPYVSYISHGTIVAASPQPPQPSMRLSPPSGAVSGTAPFLLYIVCASIKSSSHLSINDFMFILYAPVFAKTCISPVQPIRSLRCGQSVGISRKLPISPQRILCWSLLISGFEHSNSPVTVSIFDIARPSTEITISFDISQPLPLISTYLKPCDAKVGINSSVSRPQSV